jgi:hypothetical protein
VVAIHEASMGDFFLLVSGRTDWDDTRRAAGKGAVVLALTKAGTCGIHLKSEEN